MIEREDTQRAELPEAAWQKIQEHLPQHDDRDRSHLEPIIAADGSEWLRFYFELETGPKAAFVCFQGDETISYGLNLNNRNIDVVKVNHKENLLSKGESAQFQVETGMTIPTGDDLQLLVDFLLPNY